MELTLSQLGAKYGVRQTMIAVWRKKAITGLAGVFSGPPEAAEGIRDGAMERARGKIGQLVAEPDSLTKPSVAEPEREAADD